MVRWGIGTGVVVALVALAVMVEGQAEQKRLNQHNSLYPDLLRNDFGSAKISYKQQACVMCQYYVQKTVYYMMQKPGIGPGEWNSNNKTLLEMAVQMHKRHAGPVVKMDKMDYWDVFRGLVSTIDTVQKDPKVHAKFIKARKHAHSHSDDDDQSHVRFTETALKEKGKEKAKGKEKGKDEFIVPDEVASPLMDFPVTHRLSWMPGRVATQNELGVRPPLDRYSPIGVPLPNADANKDREDWRKIVAASYRWLAGECSGRMGTKFVEWCLIVLQNFGLVAKSIHYRDRPDEICYQINLCIASSYIMQAPHSPQLPSLVVKNGAAPIAPPGGGAAAGPGAAGGA